MIHNDGNIWTLYTGCYRELQIAQHYLEIYMFWAWAGGWEGENFAHTFNATVGYRLNPGKGRISHHRLRFEPLQRERKRTLLHNIVVINFLIAWSSQLQRGRRHSVCWFTFCENQFALIYLSFRCRKDPKFARRASISALFRGEINRSDCMKLG